MKCTTCGYETQPGARFCVQCGTTLPAEPVPVAARRRRGHARRHTRAGGCRTG